MCDADDEHQNINHIYTNLYMYIYVACGRRRRRRMSMLINYVHMIQFSNIINNCN